MGIPISHRVGNFFCTASCRTSTTSPKPLTDKPDHKQTSHKDKQTSMEHVPDPSRQNLFFCGSASVVRIQNGDLYHTI